MDHLCLSRCIFEIISGSPNADGVHKNVLLLLMLLTHFRITDPLFIYLFILLSTENLCHVNQPQRLSTERRKMWLQLTGSIKMSPKLQRINLPALSSSLQLYFCFSYVCLQRLEHLFTTQPNSLSCSIALALQAPQKLAFTLKLDLT